MDRRVAWSLVGLVAVGALYWIGSSRQEAQDERAINTLRTEANVTEAEATDAELIAAFESTCNAIEDLEPGSLAHFMGEYGLFDNASSEAQQEKWRAMVIASIEARCPDWARILD